MRRVRAQLERNVLCRLCTECRTSQAKFPMANRWAFQSKVGANGDEQRAGRSEQRPTSFSSL